MVFPVSGRLLRQGLQGLHSTRTGKGEYDGCCEGQGGLLSRTPVGHRRQASKVGTAAQQCPVHGGRQKRYKECYLLERGFVNPQMVTSAAYAVHRGLSQHGHESHAGATATMYTASLVSAEQEN